MQAPGYLDELPPPGREAWTARVIDELSRALDEVGETVGGDLASPLTSDSSLTPEFRSIDWPALPAHACTCLGVANALQLLDWSDGDGDIGRICHQDEYLEWRIVRDGDRIRTIEMTTELREYWEVLSAYAPDQTLKLVQQFSGSADVTANDIFGNADQTPGRAVSDRHDAFCRIMLPDSEPNHDCRAALKKVSPYNNGTSGICCMIHADNSLRALLRLVVSAARPFLVRDPVTGRTRFPSGSEAIAGFDAVATNGRHSDPLLVERLVRFTTEQRPIALDDPIGIYIRNVQHHELTQPDGQEVPASWFTFSRGIGQDHALDHHPRFQRLTFEISSDAGFGLNDLVIRRTGERLTHGGQLAALVQLTLYLRTGPLAGIARVLPKKAELAGIECANHPASWEQYMESVEK